MGGGSSDASAFAGAKTDFAYDDNAHTFSLTGSDGTELLHFNADDQLVGAEDRRGATTISRDGLGRLTGWTGPDGTALDYGLDRAGRVTSVATDGGRTTLTSDARGDV